MSNIALNRMNSRGSNASSTNFSNDTNAPLGSPITSASNIRNKVKELQRQLHQQQNFLDETNIELKRVRQMLDPLRLSMKRYTDQLEINTNKSIQAVVDQQGIQNNQIDEDVQEIKNENAKLKLTINQMQEQMDSMAQSISQLQGQVFGNYDSDSDIGNSKDIPKQNQIQINNVERK